MSVVNIVTTIFLSVITNMSVNITINILQLPDDILVTIFKKLNLYDLRNVILTCKTLKNLLLNDNTIWRSVCTDRLILNKTGDRDSNQLSWYNRCRISLNWCSGTYRNKLLMRFSTNYMPWLKLHDSEFLFVSEGSDLNCFSINKRVRTKRYDPLWTLDVPIVKRNDIRTNDISRFVIKNDVLVCGNRDGSTAIYTVDNIKEKPKLICHIRDSLANGDVEVSSVEIISSKNDCCVITASSYYPHIIFWDCTKSNIVDSVMDIQIHDGDGARCLALDNSRSKLAIGLYGNSKPLLLDVDVGKISMSANETRHWNNVVRDIRWHDENTIIYVTHSGKLNIIDVRTHLLVYEANDPFRSTLYCVKSDGNNALLVGSSEYSRCVLFDKRNSRRHTQLYFTHRRSSPVYCLDFDSSRLLAGIDRGITALNFNINAAVTHKKDYSYVFY